MRMPVPAVTQPVQIALSLSTWFIMFIGLIVLRMETHPWVNTVLLTVVFPMFIWYMSKRSLLGSVSREGILAAVIGSGLFMTLLLESSSRSPFSKRLKKNLKEFGRQPAETAEASAFIVLAMMVGLGFSYAIQGRNFIAL